LTHGPSLRGEPDFVSQTPWAGVRSISVSNNQAAYAPTYSTVAGIKVAFCFFYSYLADYGAKDVATNDVAGIAVARVYQVLLQPSAAF
jgi:hypothetical protein